VFVGRNDGRLTALDSSTGKQLWEFQTGAGMHAAVSTVERSGRQYVLAYSAGNALIGSARGDSVWMFGLDGALPPVEAGSPLRRTPDQLRDAAAPASAAAANAPADLESGKRVFTETCSICHGDGMKGLGNVPRLAGLHPIYIARQLYLFKDGTRNGGDAQLMKKPVAKLADDDILALSAYLGSLAP